jgi:hypothetical protein
MRQQEPPQQIHIPRRILPLVQQLLAAKQGPHQTEAQVIVLALARGVEAELLDTSTASASKKGGKK